jgi:magnesium chelatase subunit D
MQEAKGLALGLLRDAYVHRDAVALIAFRGTTAFRLLPPTTALARAHRELRSLPTGGGTPLAAALRELQALAQEETVRRPRPALAILLTDGRANVPLDPAVSGRAAATAELQVLGALYRRSGPKTVLIDTTAPGVMRPDARRLADLLGATYRRLEASLGR